jgi:hypothetical protein
MSWQSADGSMWLRDGLPRGVQNVNVHIYGYRSTIQHSLSTSGLAEYTSEFVDLFLEYFRNGPLVSSPSIAASC